MAWGQLQLPMLALLAGAWVALRSGRSALGGALVGLAILLKPFPLPLLLLFVLGVAFWVNRQPVAGGRPAEKGAQGVARRPSR